MFFEHRNNVGEINWDFGKRKKDKIWYTYKKGANGITMTSTTINYLMPIVLNLYLSLLSPRYILRFFISLSWLLLCLYLCRILNVSAVYICVCVYVYMFCQKIVYWKFHISNAINNISLFHLLDFLLCFFIIIFYYYF